MNSSFIFTILSWCIFYRKHTKMNSFFQNKLRLPSHDGDDEFERICAILTPNKSLYAQIQEEQAKYDKQDEGQNDGQNEGQDEGQDEEQEEGFTPPEATPEMIARYQAFLLPRLLKKSNKLKMTGREDLGYFGWEERFFWGNGSEKEHQSMKKNMASCDDKFHFIRLVDWDESLGVMAEVKRITDKKLFAIPLVDLVVFQEKLNEFQLIEDYSSWFVNFGPEVLDSNVCVILDVIK